jgi:ribonuclease P protein component
MKVPEGLSSFTKKEINAVFEAAFSVYKDNFITILAARPSIKNHGRALFITRKKIGSAPQRNLIRRQIKSIIIENQLYLKKQDTIYIIKSLVQKPLFKDILKIVLQSYES